VGSGMTASAARLNDTQPSSHASCRDKGERDGRAPYQRPPSPEPSPHTVSSRPASPARTTAAGPGRWS
jgi:hypothetical protein